MNTRLSTKGQIVLASRIRRRLGLEAGDLLDVRVQEGRVVLTPRRMRLPKVTLHLDRVTGLPVLSAGAGAPVLTSKQVGEILVEFP